MQRPLFEKKEKNAKTTFLNRPDAGQVLVNVCGFRCNFEYPFKSANTSMTGHPFVKYDGRREIYDLSMLHSSEDDERNHYYCYYEDEDFQVLRIPLKQRPKSESELALYIMLPKDRGALRMIEKSLCAESLTERIKKCVQPEHVRVSF
jgi:serine protease inhibitor